MRRFELHATDMIDGEGGEKVTVGEGIEFSDGCVVVSDVTGRANGYTIYPNGIGSLAPVFEGEEIAWLDKEPMLIVAPEESAAKHGAEAALEAQAIEHLTADVWNGDPLP